MSTNFASCEIVRKKATNRFDRAGASDLPFRGHIHGHPYVIWQAQQLTDDWQMAKSKKKSAQTQIVDCARDHFGQDVAEVSAPGGENRSSFRLQLADGRSVIGTLRPNFRRTHLEAFVLDQLNAHCDDLPECLGVVDKIMFQSDVGEKRLNVEIAAVEAAARPALAAEAIEAIFRIHAAARKTKLHEMVPRCGIIS